MAADEQIPTQTIETAGASGSAGNTSQQTAGAAGNTSAQTAASASSTTNSPYSQQTVQQQNNADINRSDDQGIQLFAENMRQMQTLFAENQRQSTAAFNAMQAANAQTYLENQRQAAAAFTASLDYRTAVQYGAITVIP